MDAITQTKKVKGVTGLTAEVDLNAVGKLILNLPPVVDKAYEKKRPAAAQPDFSILKSQQLEAFLQMQAFLTAKGGGMFLLKGYAGTGKTFTISRVIEWLLSQKQTCKIAMTAPTNKAVKVLAESADFIHSNLEYATIHRMLGLREVIDGYGNQKFQQDKRYPPSIEKYNVVIIDEVSMLSDDLFKHLYGYAEPGNPFQIKFIFMGDPAQIPPVGKEDCLPFSPVAQKKHNILCAELTEIVRQAAGNPIIELTMKIRESLARPTTFPVHRTILDEQGKGVIMIPAGSTDAKQLVEKYLNLYFNSENFKKDADFIKVIAWRNDTVNHMNRWIRQKIYGKEACQNRVVVGEKLIANKPIVEDDIIMFTTNDEFEVTDFTIKQEVINEGAYVLNYYATAVKQATAEGWEKTGVIKIIHEDSLETFNNIVEMLKQAALDKKQGSWEAAQAWTEFYEFQEMFANVNYNYAITAHKSQGSTYENVLVLAHDIDGNRKVSERNRIKYTACSRPKNRLIVIC